MNGLPSSEVPVDPLARIRATIAATTRVSVEEMRALPGFLRTSVGRMLAITCAFFVPIMALLSAFVVWRAVSRPGYFGPPWAVVFLLAFGALLTAGLVWLVGVGSQTFGIATNDEGVVVFDRPLRRKVALRRTLRWDSMKAPTLERGRRVWISGDLLGTYLTIEQARVVLADPRCPFRNQLSTEVSSALGAD